MEGYCSTGQSPQWAVVPMEEEEEEEDNCVVFERINYFVVLYNTTEWLLSTLLTYFRQ
jgi:hypothetical protein